MKLPDRDKAYIPSDKITEYLLSTTHPVGRLKARFFLAMGFSKSNMGVLEQQLLKIIQEEEVIEHVSSPYGTKFVIDGSLEGLRGISGRVRTIWIIEAGEKSPRFVTAYPL